MAALDTEEERRQAGKSETERERASRFFRHDCLVLIAVAKDA